MTEQKITEQIEKTRSPYRPSPLIEYSVGLALALPTRILYNDPGMTAFITTMARLPLQLAKTNFCENREDYANCQRERSDEPTKERNKWKFYGKMILDTAAYTAGVASAYGDQIAMAYGPAIVKGLEDLLR